MGEHIQRLLAVINESYRQIFMMACEAPMRADWQSVPNEAPQVLFTPSTSAVGEGRPLCSDLVR